MSASDDAVLAALGEAVGPDHVIPPEAAARAGFFTDWRKLVHDRGLAVVRPGSTDEVAAVVRACLQLRVAVVPQGGNTGQVAGGVPDTDGSAVVLSLTRMTRVRGIDPLNNTMTVEAGCILQAVQDAARVAVAGKRRAPPSCRSRCTRRWRPPWRYRG